MRPSILHKQAASSTEELPEMGFFEHLLELRTRLIRAISAVFLSFLALAYFSNDIYTFVAKPVRDALPKDIKMIATDVTAPFFAPFKLTMFVALFLAMPYVLYQIWRFIAPGLYANEKRLAVPLLVASVALFYLGIAFVYYLVFPIMLTFFAHTGPVDVQLTPDINLYLSLALKMFLAFGVAFQIPIATILIIATGLVDIKAVAEKRRYVIVGCFFVGMILSPPDVFSQTLLAVPMWLLFEAGLFAARWFVSKPVSTMTQTSTTQTTIDAKSETD
jgi:sec-independent protein translocase protein TatC